MTILTAVTLSVIANFVINAYRRKHITGSDGMIGKPGIALEDFTDSGQTECDGAIYSATTITPIQSRQKVIVTEVRGIKLVVKPDDQSHTQ